MDCKCITRIEELLTNKMAEEYPDGTIVDSVEFQNKTFLLSGNRMELVLNNPVLGRIRIGKKIRRYEVSMLPSYCPYCGEKIRKEESNEKENVQR